MADPRLNAQGELPDADNVVRYCKKTYLREDGTPAPGAFFPDPRDGYVSVFWLEFAGIEDSVARWADIRKRIEKSGVLLRVQGKLAKVSVGTARTGMLAKFNTKVQVKHMPVLDDGGEPPDESHCGIHGLPREDVDVGDFLATLVSELQPAKA
jgi:hypothetical protein